MIAEKTFVINLPARIDRRETVTKELAKVGIVDYRFWRATHNHNGVVGLLLTMKSLLDHCDSLGLTSVLILEDDARFLHPIGLVEDAIKQLPTNWDLLYLGVNLFQKEVEFYSPKLIKLTGGCATHAILYSRSGIERAIGMLDIESESPYDLQLVYKLQEFRNCYAIYPMVVTQSDGFSDIQGENVEYAKLLEDRFENKTQSIK